MTTLSNVEKAIDQVFHWLEANGRDEYDIEKLAPYFGVIWPSASALAGFLGQLKILRQIYGKSMVELGCGLAVPSIIASKSGAKCTVVDNHPNVPNFLKMNVGHNEPCHLRFVASDDIPGFAEKFEWIIASDVLYERSLVETFAKMVSQLATPDAQCVVADPGRPYIQEFVHAMNRYGWIDRLEPWTVPHKGQSCDVFIMVFTRTK